MFEHCIDLVSSTGFDATLQLMYMQASQMQCQPMLDTLRPALHLFALECIRSVYYAIKAPLAAVTALANFGVLIFVLVKAKAKAKPKAL